MKFDYKKYLRNSKPTEEKFSSFMEKIIKNPKSYLYTSASLISETIRDFGYSIVIRSGEPVINYKIFSDPFSDGINAIYGQEFCVDKILNTIDSADQESVPRRGLVLVGPPSSGKTNLVDMITRGLEEYTKKENVQLCTFSIVFHKNNEKFIFRSPFMHNPVLLIPTTAEENGKIYYPRKEFLDLLEKENPGFSVPNYYKNATLDKITSNILESLISYSDKTYEEILEEYVSIERTNFSIAQGRGISNIDDMKKLGTSIKNIRVGSSFREILDSFIPGMDIYSYDGPFIFSNRGILHIHDAFGENNSDDIYRPLLMLLGSGKISLESTQTFLDTSVFITTNLQEMKNLEGALTSKKLLDRIEKIPVNYLVDTNSEMEILERDMSSIKEKYDIDPNLIKISAYYSVLTRLFPPLKKEEDMPKNWSDNKKIYYRTLPPEKKMFIYASQCKDPVKTITSLPPLHPFRNECIKLGINIQDPNTYKKLISINKNAMTLEETGLFTNEEIKMIDDEFMRLLIREHMMYEGKFGISVRQIQNIMRDTISSSDGRKITVNQFLNQLFNIVEEGRTVHYWLKDTCIDEMCSDFMMEERSIGDTIFLESEGRYGNYRDLIKVVVALYNEIITKEITIATVNRDPEKIENDLRKYVQYVLLYRASKNRSFSQRLKDQYSFIDHTTGLKIDSHDILFMESIEKIIYGSVLSDDDSDKFRDIIADKFFKLKDSGDLKIKDNVSIINSRDDNFKFCFSQEYTLLLSYMKTIDNININLLEEAFYHKYNSKEKFDKCDKIIKNMVMTILNNMMKNNGYSEDMALETIIYALSERIIYFSEILNVGE